MLLSANFNFFFEDFRTFEFLKFSNFSKNHILFPLQCTKFVCITVFVHLGEYYFSDALIFVKTQNSISYDFLKIKNFLTSQHCYWKTKRLSDEQYVLRFLPHQG